MAGGEALKLMGAPLQHLEKILSLHLDCQVAGKERKASMMLLA